MSRPPPVRELPEKERRAILTTFLEAIDRHPRLDHFRAAVPGGEERRLALVAAWERAALLGNAAVHPPRHDDLADMLLCDLIDVIESDPALSRYSCVYGADRHAANLICQRIWDRKNIPTKSVAGELFATWLLNRSAEAASTSVASDDHLSPPRQAQAQNGDLIEPNLVIDSTATQSPPVPQDVDAPNLTPSDQHDAAPENPGPDAGIIRHDGEKGGEKSDCLAIDPETIPARPLRRGRPSLIDDVAKGRVLGLMAYGLSFRQAAAQLGVHHQTLLNLLKRDPELAQQVAEARLHAISQPLLTIVKASRTNWRAAAWLARFLEERRIRDVETTPEERAVEAARRS
jgi:hypothetical protein